MAKDYVENDKCPSCHEGTLKSTDLGVRIIETCNKCKHRKVMKK